MAIIAAVAAGVIYGTRAFFTTTTSTTGNTFSAGTIDIGVTSPNTWKYNITDMKPGYTSYSNFTVTNTGTNPVNVYKAVTFGGTTVKTESKAGCEARDGTWNGGTEAPCTGAEVVAPLGDVVDHSLSVKVFYDPASTTPDWFQTIWADTDNHHISSDTGNGVLLGMLPVGAKMEVTEDFYMDSSAGNKYQGEGTTFNITLTGEQLKNTVTMVHKKSDNNNWDIIDNNQTASAVLTYGEMNDTFNYDLVVNGLAATTDYVVVTGANPYNSGIQLVSFTTTGSGAYNISGQSEDLNKDLTNAKVWVILASDWSIDHMIGWHGDSYLFETAQIDYIDPIK